MQRQLRRKTVRRRLFKVGFLTVNATLLLVISLFVLHARSSTAEGTSGVLDNNAIASQDAVAVNPLDQISSADIAETVSRMSGLAETTAVVNQADSADAILAIAPTTATVTSKPEIVATAFKSNKDIQTYTVQSGDTVSSIATKFNVTSDSIKWSNNLAGDSVNAGVKLLIPPTGYSGIVYTVKAGDTIDSLAIKYKADKNELIAANDAEIGGIKAGERIIIPNGQMPAPARYASTYLSYGFAWGGSSPIYGSNGYDWGQCTWWVAKRRAEVGKPVPNNLGNAVTWKYLSQRAGIPGGTTPEKYSVIWYPSGGYGHVGFVESVDPDGTVHTSEMNVNWTPGELTYRTISASQAGAYYYIY